MIWSLPNPARFSLNPVGATSYTYTLIGNPFAHFSNGQQTITTADPYVDVYFNNMAYAGLTLKAKANYPNGNASNEVSTTFNYGPTPWNATILGEQFNVCTNAQLLPYASATYPGAFNYEWAISPNTGYIEPSTTISSNGIYLYEPGFYTVTVTAFTSCGTATIFTDYNASNCFAAASTARELYPNPVNNELTIDVGSLLTKKKPGNYSSGRIVTVELISVQGVIVKRIQSRNNQKAKINTGGIAGGVYFVRITDGKEVIRKQILIKH